MMKIKINKRFLIGLIGVLVVIGIGTGYVIANKMKADIFNRSGYGGCGYVYHCGYGYSGYGYKGYGYNQGDCRYVYLCNNNFGYGYGYGYGNCISKNNNISVQNSLILGPSEKINHFVNNYIALGAFLKDEFGYIIQNSNIVVKFSVWRVDKEEEINNSNKKFESNYLNPKFPSIFDYSQCGVKAMGYEYTIQPVEAGKYYVAVNVYDSNLKFLTQLKNISGNSNYLSFTVRPALEPDPNQSDKNVQVNDNGEVELFANPVSSDLYWLRNYPVRFSVWKTSDPEQIPNLDPIFTTEEISLNHPEANPYTIRYVFSPKETGRYYFSAWTVNKQNEKIYMLKNGAVFDGVTHSKYLRFDVFFIKEITNKDSQRKLDLIKIRDAIEHYYKDNSKYPSGVGWIKVNNNNLSPWLGSAGLAMALIPNYIDAIPCDPMVSDGCLQGGRNNYLYERCGEDYGLYARLQNPSEANLKTIEEGNSKCNDIAKLNSMNYKVDKNTESSLLTLDAQRKTDLANLKTAIDQYNTQTKKLPESDGWIASKDFLFSNDSLAETLLPAKAIDIIPCDPANTAENCKSGITYQYWRADSFGGNAKEYGLYAKLRKPTDADKATMNVGNAQMNAQARKDGMNYRVGIDVATLYQIDDAQRRGDLSKLKVAIDQYYALNKKLPLTDLWIERNGKSTLYKPLVGGKLIDQLPCDPGVADQLKCTKNTYQYWLFQSGKKGYSLYAKLDNPTDVDKATMNTGIKNINNEIAKKFGMNYRVGN